MKYLCLCYYDIEIYAKLTPEQLADIGSNCKPHDEILRRTGKVLYQGSLSEPSEWKTIRPVSGKPVISDGPLTSDAEQVGAFFIVEADNLYEAAEVASKHAAANYGEHLGMAVEVRACESFD